MTNDTPTETTPPMESSVIKTEETPTEIAAENDSTDVNNKESFSDTEKRDGNESNDESKAENEIDDKEGTSNGANENDGGDQEEKGDEGDSKEKESVPIMLGGPLDKQQEAYALLTGQYEDPKESKKTIIDVPITALPAILGRTQKVANEHIFDLGNCKALSRKHAVIFYTDLHGGKLGKYTEKNEDGSSNAGAKIHKIDSNWYYKLPVQSPTSKKIKAEDIIRPEDAELPQSGFYAIECISKNKLFVNKKRVEQGQVALLSNGTTIKMAGYCLYFLLPEDITKNTVSVPHPVQHKDQDSDDDDGNSGPPNKKIKRESGDLCEGKTLTELLDEFIKAVDNDIFERKHSLISSGIMYHAVQDVMHCAALQKTSKEENGVSRTEIMDWIGSNELYKPWVIKLLTKLEMKSYQANLSKALIKAGFTRIGTTGRHVKWVLPPTKAKRGERKKKQSEKGVNSQKKASPSKEQSAEKDLIDQGIAEEEDGSKNTEEESTTKVDVKKEEPMDINEEEEESGERIDEA